MDVLIRERKKQKWTSKYNTMQMVMNIYEDINEGKGIKHPEGLLMLCLKTTLTDQVTSN